MGKIKKQKENRNGRIVRSLTCTWFFVSFIFASLRNENLPKISLQTESYSWINIITIALLSESSIGLHMHKNSSKNEMNRPTE